jgi:DNA-binding MarR family transcriptional regulator
MTNIPETEVPANILKDSVVAQVAATYFAVARKLERITQCSATRGFILSTLRDGATPNQNQIATQLGLDRTVVHRSIKTLVREGLLSEHKAKSGRAIHIRLTPKGHKYRSRLVGARVAADDKVRELLSANDRTRLVQLLKRVAELEL